jgi:Flp pilus assembly protein TadG
MRFIPLKNIRNYIDDRNGSASVELAIISPILFFLFGGMFAYYHAIYEKSRAWTATYAVSELLSRQTVVEDEFISALGSVYGVISKSKAENLPWIRVSSISMTENGLFVLWSTSTSENHAELTTTDSVEKFFPELSAGESIILTETSRNFMPIIGWVGLTNKSYTNVIATIPRFTATLQNLDALEEPEFADETDPGSEAKVAFE